MKCSAADKGCEWEGTIGVLRKHVATCQFTMVSCPKECKLNGEERQVIRKDIADHLRAECPNRDYNCEHCGEAGSYVHITQVHNKTCHSKIVPCSNPKCGKTMQRQDMKCHLDTECDFTLVSCKYEGISCDVKLKRKDMAAHEQNDIRLHLHMALNRVSELEKALDSLSKENAKLKEERQVTFNLTDYEEKKRADKESRSFSFYSAARGYCVAIEVYANGYSEGKGSHLSVYAYILKGKHDAELKWPFVGRISITLLNQLENKNHFAKTIVMEAERNLHAKDNWGYPKFISNTKLMHDPVKNIQYLKDNALYSAHT